MWNSDFAQEIFQSLEQISGVYTNSCFKSWYGGCPYFIKKIVPRVHENMEIAQERMENTERINMFFNQCGIDTVVAVCFDSSFTHRTPTGLWVAYPWLDAEPIEQIDTMICFKIGQLLAKIHSIPACFEFKNTSNLHRRPDLSWRRRLMHTSDSRLIPFLLDLPDIVRYADWGYSCANQLQEINVNVLSHGDLHSKNIFLKDDSLVLIDWELSGSINPDEELFDVALNLCGFIDNETNLELFESVIKGYYSSNQLSMRTPQIELVIGTLTLLLIEHMSLHLNRYFSAEITHDLNQALKYLWQFQALKKHIPSFREILLATFNR